MPAATPLEEGIMSNGKPRFARRGVTLVALAALVTLLTASNTIASLINGTLPATSFTYTSVTDVAIDVSSAGVTSAQIATLQGYVDRLAALAKPTASQQAALASYQARLADYRARYAAAVALHESKLTNVKTTYSRVPPSDSYEAGWHYHNGPVVVTVTVGTLTLYTGTCAPIDILPGHSYIESPREVLNAKVLPAKNPGVANVEWFTTRLYPDGTIDPVPVPVPCTL
jgi:hypothetical protein